MDLEKTFSVLQNESYLRKIAGLSLDEALKIPTNIKNVGIGGDASFIQLIATWAAPRPNAAILTFLHNPSDDDIVSFLQKPHGLAIGLCSKKIRNVFERDHETSVRSRLEILAQHRMLELYFKEKPAFLSKEARSRGLAVEVIYADHLNFSKPNFFYSYQSLEKPLRSSKQFQSITKRIFDTILPQSYSKSITEDEIESFSITIRELLQNTDDHAQTDINGNVLRLSLRGLIARHHQMAPDKFKVNLDNIPALRSFSDRFAELERQSKNVQLIELSIFDSGPGYAQRWLKKPLNEITIQEEYNAVQKCFEKNASTKGEQHTGFGLPTLTSALRKHKGFLRLRTGRLSLCADPSLDRDELINLVDSSGNELTKMAPVLGALVTVVLPLGAA